MERHPRGMAIPSLLQAPPIQRYLEDLHRQILDLREGEVASYIPELTRADPDWFGIALVTVDGHIYQVGDSHQEFTIQSISKAITYGLALEDKGVEAVLAKVGVEPSGEAFNSISLEKDTGRPFNPMINAGAIATTGLIEGADADDKLARILRRFEKFVGHRVAVDDEVYRSERDTGHRNRAIVHLLRNANIVEGVPEEVVDLYFRQCSIRVTARDLAVMGACLANNGVNPITSVIAQKSAYVDKVLSVMTTCGMYDYSGNWVYSVGMPSKSGVGGGIMAVLPGQFGLGVFSPLLDRKGNSCRGVRVCESLSRDFGLHLLKVVRATSSSVVRVHYDGAAIHSRRLRHAAQRAVLERDGRRIRVYELQGELRFASTDSLIRRITDDWDGTDYLILDFHRVVDIDTASTHLLGDLLAPMAAAGKCLLFTGTEDKYMFRRWLKHVAGGRDTSLLYRHAATDRALEWCEEQLIARQEAAAGDDPELPLHHQYLCQGLTPDEIEALQAVSVPHAFKQGETIFRAGDGATSLFFLTRGLVDLVVRTNGGEERRVVTMCTGMSFGEFAMATGEARSLAARAVTDTLCLELAFEQIGTALKPKLMCNLARELSRRLSADARALQIVG
jgi:glutaminase